MKSRLKLLCYLAAVSIALLLIFPAGVSGQVKFGNSYVNLSKKAVGGTVQPGDTLEIRVNIYFPSGFNGNNIYFARYVDNLPTNTAFADDSLRLITNEGLTYQNWTLASDVGDLGTYLPVPGAGEYNVRINVGINATEPPDNTSTNAIGGGDLKPNTSRPRAGGGLLVTTAFKVVVTGAVGDIITLGSGKFLYKLTNLIGDPDVEVSTIPYQILISNNDPICNNAVGRNFVAEAGGTFDSGIVQNRSTGPSLLIPSYTYNPLTPATQTGDGTYAIVNNLSPYASTFQGADKRPFCASTVTPPPTINDCGNRMFTGHWDIIGDHTGSLTPDGNTPKAVGDLGGYMLVVNSDYATSEAYRQSITGLCPNTSYEFSLWVRNVCTNCGVDSTGAATWRPGVLPNLTFAIDDLDRYSSGQVDTVGWIKKGFLFKTGMAQTDITISIRNNASGGGGNDWAIDDIALVTCNPDLTMLPSPTQRTCLGQQVDLSTHVGSFFDNYREYRWEKSTDGGVTFNEILTGTGNPLPTGPGGQYEFDAALPSFISDTVDHMNQYRFSIASSPANLNDPNCSYVAVTTITLYVDNCNWVLKTDLLNFTGRLVNQHARLNWKTVNEESYTLYDIEKSEDGHSYRVIATMAGRGLSNSGGEYYFTDPAVASRLSYYRIKTREKEKYKFSKQVVLANGLDFGIKSLVNPFVDKITFDVMSPASGKASVMLIDNYGRTVYQSVISIAAGVNAVNMGQLSGLGRGIYNLQIKMDEKTITKKVLKL